MKINKKIKILVCVFVFVFILVCILFCVALLLPDIFSGGTIRDYNFFDKNLNNKIYIEYLTIIDARADKTSRFVISHKSELIEVQKNLSHPTIPHENQSVGGKYISVNYEVKFSNGDVLKNEGDLYFANENIYIRVYFYVSGNPNVFIRLDDKLDSSTKVNLMKAFP